MTPGEWGAVAALSGTVGVAITKGLDYLASRYKDRRTVDLDERKLLSEEGRELRRQILEDLTRTRMEVEVCMRRHDECQAQLTAQAVRITELERLVSILGDGPRSM